MSNLNNGGLTRVLNYIKSWVSGLLNNKSDTNHSHTWNDIASKPSFANVATSGSYNDLSNKPTIPTVNNKTLTIQKNGTTVNTFTANSSTDIIANITVPTKTSQLTNDSGFLTAHQSLSNYLTKTATVSEMGRYIDMHYDNATMARDYDVRLQVNSQGTLNGDGVLQIVGASVKASKFEGPLTGNVTGNCSGSSGSCTGNAATASKLATARSISAGDLEFQGSANFDGSGNIKLNITHHRALVTIGNTNNYPFHRIAYTAQETGNWLDRVITFFIGREYSGGGYGICRIVLRTNDAAGGATASCVVEWLVRTSSIPVDAIQVGFNNTAAASYVDVFYKSSGSYSSAICRVISHASSRTNVGQGFAVVSTSSEVNNTTTSDPLTSTESYATIAAAGTKIRGKAYTSTITASDAGIVNFATYNANGKELVNSIIKGLSVSGRTITYTKLDGSTGTITTQDTTYTIPTKTSQLTNDSGFWTGGGGTWNPNANISLPASANNQEWSFDISRNGKTGCYWHVWDGSLGTLLKVNADDGAVSVPRNIFYLGSYKVYVG